MPKAPTAAKASAKSVLVMLCVLGSVASVHEEADVADVPRLKTVIVNTCSGQQCVSCFRSLVGCCWAAA